MNAVAIRRLARNYVRAYRDMYRYAGRYFPLIHWHVALYREAMSLRTSVIDLSA